MRFTELEKAEVWDRWQGGEAMRSIARRLGRESSVRTFDRGLRWRSPVPRRRHPRHLSVIEREEIFLGGWLLGSLCVRSPVGWVGHRRRCAGRWHAMGAGIGIGPSEPIGLP